MVDICVSVLNLEFFKLDLLKNLAVLVNSVFHLKISLFLQLHFLFQKALIELVLGHEVVVSLQVLHNFLPSFIVQLLQVFDFFRFFFEDYLRGQSLDLSLLQVHPVLVATHKLAKVHVLVNL